MLHTRAGRPDADELAALSEVVGLAPDWKRRLGERARWLRTRSRAAS
ncbi:hypothetical protein BLA17378_03116 [Burkholderia aenigmatica]|uniref:Uncharacterized protein n=1 Tax=Burkholderia aenigmatica TaxID=2015348 RepID=A0ABY6XWA4_9BURK|nr:hypothetical protein BLA17378_03116 [Burkholderia aenigmatica]VWC95573.1 hypothetical protein BLA18628_02168 [Burkholderia aenigmatica]